MFLFWGNIGKAQDRVGWHRDSLESPPLSRYNHQHRSAVHPEMGGVIWSLRRKSTKTKNFSGRGQNQPRTSVQKCKVNRARTWFLLCQLYFLLSFSLFPSLCHAFPLYVFSLSSCLFLPVFLSTSSVSFPEGVFLYFSENLSLSLFLSISLSLPKGPVIGSLKRHIYISF